MHWKRLHLVIVSHTALIVKSRFDRSDAEIRQQALSFTGFREEIPSPFRALFLSNQRS